MKQGDRGQFEAVGHVEQMESSRCFRESQGRLGCISCHDPHRLPGAVHEGRVLSRTLHRVPRAEGLRLAVGREAGPGAGRGLHRVPHAAAGRHECPPHGGDGPPYPPRRDRPGPGETAGRARSAGGDRPCVDFHWAQMTEEERRDAGRDLGVA